MCIYRPLSKGSLSTRFISLFYDILYILLRYSPLRSETVSPSAADFYILHNRSTSYCYEI